MRLSGDLGELLPLLIAVFAVAATGSLVLTPQVRRLAVRLDNIDHPDHRRVNASPTPRGGGVAVAISFVAVAIALLIANGGLEVSTVRREVEPGEILALLLGGAAAALLGVLDDTLQLRARWQLLGQVALALFAAAAGISVGFLNNPFGPGIILLQGPFAVAFVVVWIVGMINSINFIDGLDGLSTGITLIAAVTLGLISIAATLAQPLIGLLCFGLAGALLGFLRWNFHPASIFIGTSGVMFVGYTLAVLAILGSAKVVVALLVLGVPIIDTFWIIVRRLVTGRSPFTPDRKHIHHRLLDLGLSHGQTVLVIYALCLVLAVLSFLLSGTGQVYAFLGLAVAFGLGLFLLTRFETAGALEPETYDEVYDETNGSGPEPGAPGPDGRAAQAPRARRG
jgi:UDP-GlcNAc:undecaprenyl-phosphate/decaprenyl-phosphate GlcNAc-1-phosphate transferase